MRNRGPGKWREWRWAGITLPLLPPEKPSPDVPPDPALAKPLTEIAYETISKLTAINCQAKLTECMVEFAKEPDSPGGRFSELRLRELFRETAAANLTKEAPSRTGSRKPSKARAKSKEPAPDG
eukprot:TRINITY_DN6821_c0_g1_i1.p1 TRINITY_DN6821_c0_g1~~TRINITY_DN6821_c0_g1_i1.p1  ORF type:complete len:124 (-),score=23.17 TRINITY_DN6821_c0_g1_i1:127-498(-)